VFRSRLSLFVLGFVAICPVIAAAAEPARWTLALKLNNQFLEGTPLVSNKQEVVLLSRDGKLWTFHPEDAKDFRKASNTFRGYSAAEMRERLSAELGRGFEVTHTGHYLVAVPRGSKADWAPRFEEMYRQFVHYFSIRGLAPREPEFPLVAIVFPTQEAFQRYARAEGSPFGPNYLGYYSGRSNRVALYDQQTTGGNWSDNADTIIHEVTHQTAYNTGVHRRFADVPRWLVEGLGTMFEARGVWNSRSYSKLQDRVNVGRLRDFQSSVARRKPGLTAELISSDRMFETDMIGAYAEAWAFSFYLSEKMPKKYCDYLSLTAKRPTFTDYPAGERVRDFTTIFGDLKLLESQFLRFMAELK
jgi:hypothetical protein